VYGARNQLALYGKASQSRGQNASLFGKRKNVNFAPQNQGAQLSEADLAFLARQDLSYGEQLAKKAKSYAPSGWSSIAAVFGEDVFSKFAIDPSAWGEALNQKLTLEPYFPPEGESGLNREEVYAFIDRMTYRMDIAMKERGLRMILFVL
jgi:hypothetical protein